MSAIESSTETAAASQRESERKFVVSPLFATRFLERIAARTKLELADPTRPVEFNRTTYLDTADLAYLRSSQSGLARKLRIREYATSPCEGAPASPTGAFLELKETGGRFRSKTRVRLAGTLESLLDAGPDLPQLRMFRDLFREQQPVPMLTSRYRRVRRTCLEAPVRVTVDSEVCFMPPIEPGSPIRFDRPVFRIASAVIEVKASGDLPAWLLAELDAESEDRTFSKFEQGMRLLGGNP